MEEESGNEIIPLNEETQIALRPETQIALSSEDENQRGVALRFPVNPSFHLNQGAFDKPNFGPQTNTKHIEANTIEHATITNVHHHYGGDGKSEESPSTRPKQKLEEGFVQIADDIFINTKKPLKEGSKIYEGYQEHVTGQRQRIAIKAIFPCTKKSMREVRHLVTLTPHPNVVRIIRSKENNAHVPTLYIAMELCSSKNLQDYLKENREKNTPFDFKKTMSYCKRLIKGMKHIHCNRIIHGDLKPENILFSLVGDQIKVSDFGISKQLEQAKSKTKRTNQGTDGYRAPETYNFNVISMKADIFSLGVILYALFTNGKHPFGEDNDLWIFNIKKNRGRDLSDLPEEMGDKKDEFLDLLNKMLELDREKRPTIEEISMHPFFSGQATTAQASQQEEVLPEPPSVMSTTPERIFASEETQPKERREVTVRRPHLFLPHRPGNFSEGARAFGSAQTQPKQDACSAPNEPKCSLRSYDLQPGCDEKILLFIQNNQTHLENLQNSFKDFAVVQFLTGENGNSRPSVKFAPDKKTTGETQRKFNGECKKRFEVLLTDYSSVSPSFDQSKLQKARSAKLSPLFEQSYKGDGVNIIVNWKNGSVDVTGLEVAVSNFVEQIITCMDFTVRKIATNVDQYRLMVSCGIIGELQQKYPTVNVKCDDRLQSVTLTGPHDDVNTVEISALTMLSTIEKKRLTGLDDIILRYLAEMIKDSVDIKMQIQDKLKNAGVKAALSADGDDVYICVRTTADYKRAFDLLKQLIGVESIMTDEASFAVVSTPRWKGFHQSLKGIGSFRVYVKPRGAIAVVGVRADLQPVRKKINDFLDDNATRRFYLRMPYGSARFIVEKSKEFSQDSCRRNGIKCGLTAEGGGVYVEGNRKALAKAHPEVKKLREEIIEVQCVLEKPGSKEFYSSEDGKQFLANMERINNCIILTGSRQIPEWVEYNRKNASSAKPKKSKSSSVAFDIEFNSKNPPTPSTSTPSSRFSFFTPHTAPAYPSSPPTTKRKAKPKKNNAKSAFQKIDESSVSFGQFIASIQQGDITKQKCDVIVNSHRDQRFTLNEGMVSTQILSKGGQRIQDETFEAGALKKGADYVVTTGGSLPCRKIIHLVTPENLKDLHRKIVRLLMEVEKLKLRSVCIPAFGMLSMDIESVGSVMQDAINQFAKSYKNLRHLEYVTIVIFDKKVLESFKNGFFNPKKGLLERLFGWGGSVMDLLTFSPEEEEQEEFEELAPTPTPLKLYFYSTSEEHIDQAVQFITDEARKFLHRVVVEDTVISRITDWEKHDIIESGKKHNVHITDNSNRYLMRLVLEGITKEVIKAHEEIKDILREFQAAETCSSFVTWQKKNPDGKWVNYHLRSANVLEQAHRARLSTSRGSASSTVQVPEFHLDKVIEHTVDLSLLDGGGQQGKPPQVKRTLKERNTNDIPDFWDDMQRQPLVIVPILTGSQEYQNVLAKFQTTAAVFYQSIVSIERIQNLSLYKQYVAKRGEVTEKLKNFGGQVERHLFHGTSNDEQIILHGFDRSYAGKNNILYGRGVYFATDPGFSHGYAQPDTQGHRKMFLADVITGEYCVGNSSMVCPPQRTNSPIKYDLFDSTVNNGTNPTIFVIYKHASCYPAYRITYT